MSDPRIIPTRPRWPEANTPMPPLERAREAQRSFTDAAGKAATPVVGLECLFGRAASLAVREPLDAVLARHGDVVDLYETAIIQGQREVQDLQGQLEEQNRQIGNLLGAGATAIAELASRYERAKKDMPAELAEARQVIRDRGIV